MHGFIQHAANVVDFLRGITNNARGCRVFSLKGVTTHQYSNVCRQDETVNETTRKKLKTRVVSFTVSLIESFVFLYSTVSSYEKVQNLRIKKRYCQKLHIFIDFRIFINLFAPHAGVSVKCKI